MDQAQRDGVGAALRKVHKGPADAVIRTVSAADAEAAFNDEAGGRGTYMPGDNKLGGSGARGSVAGVRLGVKDSEGRPTGPAGGLDVRAAENMRIRQQRNAGAGRAARPATAVPQNRAPVQAPSQAVSGPLEDWEVEALAPPAQPLISQAREAAPGAQEGRDGFTPGDQLAVATMDALALLDRLPEGFELFVGGNGLGPEGVRLVMGLGFLIGKGYAAYRGDSHYRITAAGRAAARRGEAQHA